MSVVAEERGAADADLGISDPPTDVPRGSVIGRTWRWLAGHPLTVTAVFAGFLAIVQSVWIWTHRLVGAIDPDESGYVATSFYYHHILSTDPLALPRAIGGTGNAPLIPLLSVPLLWAGPNDPRTVLLMQPVLMFAAAIATAGIARRLAGNGAAIVTGILYPMLPTVVFATQTYWLGLGASTFMALAIWALLESDRLTNRWTYAYGALMGLTLLSRTMTLGFIPAMVGAGLVMAWWRRESLIGLAKALGTMLLVAGPWYFVARGPIFDYLFSYGYGKRAGLFGDGGPAARLRDRLLAVISGMGYGSGIWLVVAGISLVVLLLHWHGWPRASRSALAISAAIVLGIAALVSTTNSGVWFELPVVTLLLPLVVAVGAKAPLPVRAVALVPVLAASMLQMLCALWVIAPGERPVWGVERSRRVAQYEYGFEQYDPRFGPDRRDELHRAAADWWELSTGVERYLHQLSPDGQKVFTMSGNFELFNSNTLQLAGILKGWMPRAWIPDTVGTTEDRAAWLTPTATDDAGNDVTGPDGKPVERVLVLAIHDQHLFTPDAEVKTFYREALDAGWKVERRFSIPVGGDVVVLRHPDNL